MAAIAAPAVAEMARMAAPPMAALAPIVPVAGAPPTILPGVRVPGMEMPPKLGSLYVGDLAPDVNETTLLEKFAPIGNIASLRICRDIVSGRSLGYGYVNFQSYADAERAIATLNYEPLNGNPMRIMFSNRDPSSRRSAVGNIFIKKLHPSVDSKTLHDTFSQFGRILSCKVCADERGQSKRFGYVNFETAEAAQLAIEKVDGMIIADTKVSVSKFVPKSERASNGGSQSTFTNVFVKNLAATTSEDDMRNLFLPFGEITSIHFSRDAQGRPYGFINFALNESAVNAIDAINGKEVDGCQLYCGRAMKREERQAFLRRQFEQRRRELEQKSQHLNLYIKNLDDNIDDARLREEFSRFGKVVSVKVMRDPVTNVSKGFGFVSFATPDEATKAVTEMNTRIIATKPLYVALAQRKAERQAAIAAQRHRAVYPGMFYPQIPPFAGFPRGPGPQFMMGPRNLPAAMPLMPGAFPQLRPPYNPNMRRGVNNAMQAPRQPNRPVVIPAQMMYTGGQEPLTASALAAASDAQRKQVLGERLFPKIHQQHGPLAGKITGMLLEMDNSELLHLLEDDTALREKAAEALAVLREHERKQSRPVVA